ncbi:hypothetical protein ACH9L7_15800 [Haloferax sp. S1W]|uniref:hypothetical protein n=1 Tax=Haloferax sp. S1W TaxID=3377110 RepID=UPI0037C72B6A
MDIENKIGKQNKITVSLSLLIFSGTVLSIESQIMSGILVGIISLVLISVLAKNEIALGLTAISLTILYPGPHTGYLFGRDTHDAAKIAEGIAHTQWPVESITGVAGFQLTPGVHIFSVVAHQVTGLNIYPSTKSTLLITYLFPIFLALATLMIVYLVPRKWTTNSVITFIPTLLWVRYHDFIPTLHRTTLAMVGVSLVYFLISFRSRFLPRKRVSYSVVVFLSLSLIVISHHFSAIIVTSMVIIYSISKYLSEYNVTHLGLNFILNSTPIKIAGLALVGFFGWYYLNLGGLRYGAAIIVSLLGSSQVLAVETPEFTASFLTILETTYADWLYQIILATLIVLSWLQSSSKDVFDNFGLLFGVFIGGLSIVAMQTGFILFDRVLTFFVLFGGWVALKNVNQLYSKRTKRVILTCTMVLCLFLSIIMVPTYIISDNEPDYSNGIRNERFLSQNYAISEYLGTHSRFNGVLGDEDIFEVVAPTAGLTYYGGYPSTVLATETPNKSVVVLAERNKHVYYARGYKYGSTKVIKTRVDNMLEVADKKNKIYTSGDFRALV